MRDVSFPETFVQSSVSLPIFRLSHAHRVHVGDIGASEEMMTTLDNNYP